MEKKLLIKLQLKLRNSYEIKSYNLFADMHEKDIMRTHRMVSLLLEQLENHVERENIDQFKHIWGDKENVVGALTKVSSMLLKLIPIENSIAEKTPAEIDDNLTQTDREILEQYVANLLKENDSALSFTQ